jgi:acetyl esterase/lipase
LCVDVQVGDGRCSYNAVAVAPDMHYLAWIEGHTRAVWLSDVDEVTGDLKPLSGKGLRLGTLPYDSEWLPSWNPGSGAPSLSFQSVDGWFITVSVPAGERPIITRLPHRAQPHKHSLPAVAARRLSQDVAHEREDYHPLVGRDRTWKFSCVRPPASLVWQLHRRDLGDDGSLGVPVWQDVPYGTGAGKPLLMDIYKPSAGGSPVPAVLYIHGGAWIRGTKSSDLDLIDIQALVQAGFAVAALDYRLSPEHRFPAQIEDVKCAVRYLRSHAAAWSIDPDRIGAAGGSAGGHLAAMLGLMGDGDGFEGVGGWENTSSAVQAVCDMYGPADLTEDYTSLSRVVEILVLRRREKDAPELAVASPVTYVHPGAPPFLLMHGDKDNIVVLHQSELLYERLQEAGVPARLVVAHHAAHCFHPADGPVIPSRHDLTRIMCDFFSHTLKGTAN